MRRIEFLARKTFENIITIKNVKQTSVSHLSVLVWRVLPWRGHRSGPGTTAWLRLCQSSGTAASPRLVSPSLSSASVLLVQTWSQHSFSLSSPALVFIPAPPDPHIPRPPPPLPALHPQPQSCKSLGWKVQETRTGGFDRTTSNMSIVFYHITPCTYLSWRHGRPASTAGWVLTLRLRTDPPLHQVPVSLFTVGSRDTEPQGDLPQSFLGNIVRYFYQTHFLWISLWASDCFLWVLDSSRCSKPTPSNLQRSSSTCRDISVDTLYFSHIFWLFPLDICFWEKRTDQSIC